MADVSLKDVVDAVNDLTRVTIALHGKFASKSDAVRRLASLSIPSARIAAVLAMSSGDVASALAKAKKIAVKKQNGSGLDDSAPDPIVEGVQDNG